ncbi:MAG TPA: hypothetical protein VKA19_01270, partial [Alphaproteobacteria bacterium]|nr:hypothetical protein [Alphaproteobacteria bacterium]
MAKPWKRDWSGQSATSVKPWERDWSGAGAPPQPLEPATVTAPGSGPDNPVAGATVAPPIADPTTGAETPWYQQRPDQTAPAASEPSTFLGDTPRNWQIAAQGTGRGLANIAGLIPDIAAMGGNALNWLGEKAYNALPGDQHANFGRTVNPPLGSASIADFFAKHLMEPAGVTPIEQQDMTPREQLGYNIDNFGTQALTGGGGLATKAASQAERAIAEGGRLAPSILDNLTKAYLDNPGKALATDAAAGAGGGAAVTGAHHYLPDWAQGPVTDMLATLIGGAGGASMANASRIPGAVKSTVRGMSVAPEVKVAPGDHPFTNKQVDLASQYVQGKMANPQQGAQNYRASVRDALANSDPVPAADMASKDIGLLDLGKIARQRDPVPFERNNQAIRDRALERTLTLRDVNANPRAPQEYANKVAGQQRQQAQQGVGAAQQQLEAAQQQLDTNKNQAQDIAAPVLATRGTTGDASQALDKTVVDETMKPRQTQKNDLINQVDKSGTAVVDPARIQDTLKSIKDRAGKLTGGRELPTEFTDKLSALTDEQKTVTVRDLTEMRPYLTKASEQARNAGEYGLKDNIDTLRRQS